jgi:hypothetical protein
MVEGVFLKCTLKTAKRKEKDQLRWFSDQIYKEKGYN